MTPVNLSPFHEPPAWQRWVRGAAGIVSVGAHLVAGLFLLANPEAARKASEWVEVAVQEVKPPPPPPPPPPPAEKPKAKPIAFKDLPTVAPPPTPQPQAAPPPRRLVQGLSASSFVKGAGTGLSVHAGNTTAVAATGEKFDPADAGGAYGQRYSAVSVPPKFKYAPDLVVTEEAKKAAIDGKISVLLDLDATGRPSRVRVVKGLGYGLDEACVTAWMKSSWKPAQTDGTNVPVTGVPQTCTVYPLQ